MKSRTKLQFGFLQDDQEKCSNVLLRSEERYRSITENINEIWMWQKEGKLKAVFTLHKKSSYNAHSYYNPNLGKI